MLELNVSKTTKQTSPRYGKYYARIENKKQMSIHDMAVHMAEHNTPFSVGTIEGILRDFVSCTREQCLNGNTVKVDNLAIFSASLTANALTLKAGAKVTAAIGEKPNLRTDPDAVQPAVKTLKLLARSTGDFTREELNKEGELRWTKAAKAEIDAIVNPDDDGNGGA